MPLSLQRSGLTGRISFLGQNLRDPRTGLTPAVQTPEIPDETVTEPIYDESGTTPAPGPRTEAAYQNINDVPALGRFARDFKSNPLATSLNYGLGLLGSIAVGNPAPLVMAGLRHGATNIVTDVVKNKVVPFVKENVLGIAPEGGGLAERGGSWGEDVAFQGGFDTPVSERGGSWGEDVGMQGGFDPQEVGTVGGAGGLGDYGGYGQVGEDSDSGWF